MLVPTVRTSCTTKELSKAIIEVWNELYGGIPSKASVGIIVAQRGTETGGGIYTWNYNICNIKYSKLNGDVDFCSLKNVWEIVNGKRIELTPSDPGSWFRSFPTLNEGVKFYLQFLHNNRYKASWAAIEKGDVALFAHLLKVGGYYTDFEQNYVNGMNRFFIPFMKSQDYEDALAEANLPAPPLQPPVVIPDEPAPELGELTVISENPKQQDIGLKNTSLLQGILEKISQWLKLKL